MRKIIITAVFIWATGFQAVAFGAELKIGLIAPLSGPWALEGRDMVDVVTLVAEKINQSGGIKGQPIQLVIVDDGGQAQAALDQAPALVEAGVVAVIGPYTSEAVEVTQFFLASNGILQISPAASFDGLSEHGIATFLRMIPRDEEQSRALADYIFDRGFTKIALVREESLYGENLARELKTILLSRGVGVVFGDPVIPKVTDYGSLMAKIKAENPDLVVFIGNYPDAAKILRAKKALAWPVPVLGSDGTGNRALIELAGLEAAEGYCFVSPVSPAYDYHSPRRATVTEVGHEAFLANYERRYQSLPTSVWGLMAGDALDILAEAMQNADGFDALSWATYLKSELRDRRGFTGPISFDSRGDRDSRGVYRLYGVDGGGAFVPSPLREDLIAGRQSF